MAPKTKKSRLQMKMQYYMKPYHNPVYKEDKGMNFMENKNQWNTLANFILSDKTNLFKETLHKMKFPDVRDRIINRAKNARKFKSNRDSVSLADTNAEFSSKQIRFLSTVDEMMKLNNLRSKSIFQTIGERMNNSDNTSPAIKMINMFQNQTSSIIKNSTPKQYSKFEQPPPLMEKGVKFENSDSHWTETNSLENDNFDKDSDSISGTNNLSVVPFKDRLLNEVIFEVRRLESGVTIENTPPKILDYRTSLNTQKNSVIVENVKKSGRNSSFQPF